MIFYPVIVIKGLRDEWELVDGRQNVIAICGSKDVADSIAEYVNEHNPMP